MFARHGPAFKSVGLRVLPLSGLVPVVLRWLTFFFFELFHPLSKCLQGGVCFPTAVQPLGGFGRCSPFAIRVAPPSFPALPAGYFTPFAIHFFSFPAVVTDTAVFTFS